MEMKIVGVTLAAFVSLVVLAAVLMPILDDATTVNETFDNTPYAYYQMKELESGDNWTRADGVWTVNGEVLTASAINSISVIAVENGVVRQSGQVRSTTYTTNNTQTADIVTVSDQDVLKINTNSIVGNANGYGAANEGDYIIKTYDDKAYVKGDTPIWATGVTNLAEGSSNTFVVHIEGTIDDGFTVTATKTYGAAVSNLVVGDYTVNYSEVSGYNDLYLLDNITFDVSGDYTSGDDTISTSVTATYSTFILPKEITAERSVHFTAGMNELLMVIPVLVIVAILLAVIALVIRSKLE